MDDILLAAKKGDERKFAELLRQYSPLIDTMSDKFRRSSGADGREDFRQEACIAFYNAVLSYDDAKSGVTFGFYAKICIRNRMISLLRKESAKERQRRRADRAPVPSSADTRRPTDSGEREALHNLASSLLSRREMEIFDLYISGNSYRHIAESLCITEKSVDNALFRAKKKLRNRLRKP